MQVKAPTVRLLHADVVVSLKKVWPVNRPTPIRLTAFYLYPTPGRSYGDMGISLWGRPNREIVHQRETPGTPLSISLSWLECPHKETWVLRSEIPSLPLSGIG